MKISDVEVRCCRRLPDAFDAGAFRTGDFSAFQFLAVTMKTDEGLSATTFGFAGRSAEGAGKLIADTLRPFMLGRDPRDREKAWHEFRTADRWWGHLPIYGYGPFDTLQWLLSAEAAGQPLYKYLGAYRDDVPVYGSSMILSKPEDYAKEALRAKAEGLKAYKLHTPGKDLEEDLEAHRLVREAVGPDFTLMSDPVSTFNLEQAIRFGRALEGLGYYWYEEPLYDEDVHALRELTRTLEIPLVGTEVLAKHPYSIAECIATRVVDRVRADVSWTGGVTGVMKTARLAEAFGVNCEIHTSIFHPAEIVNLHCCAAVKNCDFFELLYPAEGFAFGLKDPLPIENGVAKLPSRPGLGVDLDWDDIDRCTVAIV
ncbi:L-alanine-DL-glutamate epimerase-like enolase superfamily enzyme [Hyphomicrobiales bacterium]|nr:L-alanine-DL-glutamate epimerase-like enolase superfamily enzyme [Hyphomicrobiales bacterium]CAH1674346.1 L-alanine-DL-glutamate epimerase-like enolase superfamily enzyme [Hyphomicrobiales bacterium]